MRHYPRIPEGQTPKDVCSEVAPIIIHTVDQSQDVIPDHSQLTELDKPNQHPIEAIIGLKEELERLNNKEVIVEETDPTVPEWATQPTIMVRMARRPVRPPERAGNSGLNVVPSGGMTTRSVARCGHRNFCSDPVV